MPTRLAVKRLSASDLTFFEYQHRTRKVGGNQKSINLNAGAFIKQLYPLLPEHAVETDGWIPVDLTIYGPDGAPRHNIQRKIVKGDSYKNWRLNGEFVHNPDESPERYNSLVPGDLALIGFTGDVVKPSAATIVLLGHAASIDSGLFSALNGFLGTPGSIGRQGSMRALTANQLQSLVDASEVGESHPALTLVAKPVDEDQLGPQASRRLGVRRIPRKQGREELERWKRLREALGRRGEEIVNSYLRGSGARDIHWLEGDNDDATAPYDFQYSTEPGAIVRVEVKTSTTFDKLFYLSGAELEEIRDGNGRHDLYRVYGIDESGRSAMLRIVEDIRPLAISVLKARLPDGVAILSVAVNPTSLDFGNEIGLSLPTN